MPNSLAKRSISLNRNLVSLSSLTCFRQRRKGRRRREASLAAFSVKRQTRALTQQRRSKRRLKTQVSSSYQHDRSRWCQWGILVAWTTKIKIINQSSSRFKWGLRSSLAISWASLLPTTAMMSMLPKADSKRGARSLLKTVKVIPSTMNQ